MSSLSVIGLLLDDHRLYKVNAMRHITFNMFLFLKYKRVYGRLKIFFTECYTNDYNYIVVLGQKKICKLYVFCVYFAKRVLI